MGNETRVKQPWVLILAGGSGTRFWPASRRANPKHVLPGLGGEGRSLLQATIDRVLPLTRPERVFVLTSADQAKIVRPHMEALAPEQLIMEPTAKNTGPAVALGLVWLSRLGAGAHDPVVVLPADAWVDDEAAFRETVLRAAYAAQLNKAIVTLGVTPNRAETGYGWIGRTDEVIEVDVAGDQEIRRVSTFIEKPDAETAQAMLDGGNHVWNAGIFVFRLGYLWWLLGDLDEEWDLAMTMLTACLVDGDHVALETEYSQFTPISLDHGVIEKAPSLLCIEAPFGWSDLGTWDSVAPVLDSAPGGQARARVVFAKDAENNVVFAPGRAVALLGVSDLVVVVTDDAVLVTPRERSQEVRELVEAAAASGEDQLL